MMDDGAGAAAEAGSERVLVTGGAGFLGSHLCERLLNEGHEVFCLDNFHTGSKANVLHLLENPRFHIVHHDVTLPFSLHVDRIFNLACPASPVHYQFDPVHTIKTSVIGSLNMLELAERLGARILQASTSEVYGDPEQHPQAEQYWGNVNSFGPRACYDEGKRCAEALFYAFRERAGVRVKLARIFNTYGPRMHEGDGRVVSNFVTQALRGEPITLYGDGSQTRSFCYVDDLVDGLVRLMDAPDDVVGPVNLGNPVECTVRELAEKVVELTGSISPLVYKPLPVDDPCRRRPDISLARDVLGWEPSTQLTDGLAATIDYFDAVLRGRKWDGMAVKQTGKASRVAASARSVQAADKRASGHARAAKPAVLVTGGAGYVGAHVCKALDRAGFLPVTFDSLARGHREAVKWGPLCVGDLRDPKALAKVLAEFDPVGVIHLAALAYVGESMAEPGRYFGVNVVGTLNLLNAMAERGVKPLVFSSSCATYGVPDTLPIGEDHPQRPVNPYGESKLIAEKMMGWFDRRHGLRVASLRYFNAAGADPWGEIGENHDPETHLIPRAVDAAVNGGPPLDILGSDYPTPDGTAGARLYPCQRPCHGACARADPVA